jgi:hypothetical protein
MKKKTLLTSRANAIRIAMNHNNITREQAEKYTDSELKEVLRHIDPSFNYNIVNLTTKVITQP